VSCTFIHLVHAELPSSLHIDTTVTRVRCIASLNSSNTRETIRKSLIENENFLGVIVRPSGELHFIFIQITLYRALVRFTNLEYGNIPGDPSTASATVERTQNKFLRIVTPIIDIPLPPHDGVPVRCAL